MDNQKVVDVVWVAGSVSKAAMVLHPPRKVSYMVNASTAVMEPCFENIDNRNSSNILESFWPPDCGLSLLKQRDFYWQYNRSNNCQNYVLFLARTLQELVEAGVRLEYQSCPVVDIWVFNALEFDVSDLLSSDQDRILNLHDPSSGISVPVITTHQVMDQLKDAGPAVCARMGYGVPSEGDAEKQIANSLKKHRQESYKGSVPHWWIAVKIRHPDGSNMLVHIDICGAAYDPDKGFMLTDGFSSDKTEEPHNHVPLLVFQTPEYELMPNNDLKHKFIVLPSLRVCLPGTDRPPVSLQPKSVRHFRCYHRHDNSMLEVTPLGVFIDRQKAGDEISTEVNGLVAEMRDDMVLYLAKAGDTVVIQNVKSQTNLNGQVGMVTDQVLNTKMANGRIPVRLLNQTKVVALKPECIKFQIPPNNDGKGDDDQPARSYSTLKDMKKQHAVKLPKKVPKDPMKNMSSKDLAKIQRLLTTNPSVQRALSEIQSSKLTFTGFADPEIRRGVELLLQPPLSTILPMEVRQQYGSALEIIKHPSAPAAVQIINMLKTAKQRIAEEQPHLITSMGSVAIVPGSDLDRLQQSIAAKIRSDAGLAHVFDRLQECGMYMNPARSTR